MARSEGRSHTQSLPADTSNTVRQGGANCFIAASEAVGSKPREPCATGTGQTLTKAASDRLLRRHYRVLPAFRNLPKCTVTPVAMTNKRHFTHMTGISQMDSPMVSQRRVTARRKLCAEIVCSSRY